MEAIEKSEIVIEKNHEEQYRIRRTTYNGREYVDCRIFEKDEDTWKPTKKGLTIPLEKVDSIVAGIMKMAFPRRDSGLPKE